MFLMVLVSLLNFVRANSTQSGFVYREGSKLCLDGKPFHFLGVNRYDLADTYPLYGNNTTPSWPPNDLDWFFNQVSGMGITGLRFWVYKNTSLDIVDSILDHAANFSIKCVITLSDQWDSCPWTNNFGFKYSDWYQTGYLYGYEIEEGGCAPPTFPVYIDWVRIVVSRYVNHTAVMMWQMMNEGECVDVNNSCDALSFYQWAENISAEIRSIDKNHLINIGTSGTGQCGAQGNQYATLYNISTVDLLEAHDYGYPELALPNGQYQNSSLGGGLYLQDKNYVWWSPGSAEAGIIGNWTQWFSGMINTSAIAPFHAFGLSFWTGGWNTVGSFFIDNVIIGSTIYSFEDGTTEGWTFNGCVTNISASTEVALVGLYSLKVTINCTENGGGAVHVTPPSTSKPGDNVSLGLYVSLGFPPIPTIASDLLEASPLVEKPFFIGESGIMSNCNGTGCYTREERAVLMKAKIDAVFENNGAGYLIWSYCYWNGPLAVWDFNVEDPLYMVLKNKSQELWAQDQAGSCSTGPYSTTSYSTTLTSLNVSIRTPLSFGLTFSVSLIAYLFSFYF